MEKEELKTGQMIITDKLLELNPGGVNCPENLKGFRVLVYHESTTLEDILNSNSDAMMFNFK